MAENTEFKTGSELFTGIRSTTVEGLKEHAIKVQTIDDEGWARRKTQCTVFENPSARFENTRALRALRANASRTLLRRRRRKGINNTRRSVQHVRGVRCRRRRKHTRTHDRRRMYYGSSDDGDDTK
uniref:Uncharacterized protein n=1 Tax=Sipha flava TaxID=143950 RepID=A0A2S2QL06_9HEMI